MNQHHKKTPKENKEIIFNAEAIDSETGKKISNSNIDEVKNAQEAYEKKVKKAQKIARVIKIILPIIIIAVIIIAIIAIVFWAIAALIIGGILLVLGIIVVITRKIMRLFIKR